MFHSQRLPGATSSGRAPHPHALLCPKRACTPRSRRTSVRAESSTSSHPVKLSFKLKKHLTYGLHLVITGGSSAMGNWDPKQGLKLQWTDGDVWTTDTELPSGTKVEYKYVTRSKTGAIGDWQGGANMFIIPPPEAATCDVRDTWEGKSVVTITGMYTPPAPPPLPQSNRPGPTGASDPLEEALAAAGSRLEQVQQMQEQLAQPQNPAQQEQLQQEQLEGQRLKEQVLKLQRQVLLEQQQERELQEEQRRLEQRLQQQQQAAEPAAAGMAASQDEHAATTTQAEQQQDLEPHSAVTAETAADAVAAATAIAATAAAAVAAADATAKATAKAAAAGVDVGSTPEVSASVLPEGQVPGLAGPSPVGSNGHGTPRPPQGELIKRFKNEWAVLNGALPSGNGNGSQPRSADTSEPPPASAVSSLASFDTLDGSTMPPWMHRGPDDGDVFQGIVQPQTPMGARSNGRSGRSQSLPPLPSRRSPTPQYSRPGKNGNGSGYAQQRANGAAPGGASAGGNEGVVGGVSFGGAGGVGSSGGRDTGTGAAGLTALVTTDGPEARALAETEVGAEGMWGEDAVPAAVMVVRAPRMRRVILTPEGHTCSRLGSMTVSEMRHELKKRGLACHGHRSDLLQRLVEAGMEW